MRLSPHLLQTLNHDRLMTSNGSQQAERRYPWYVFGGKTDEGTQFELTPHLIPDHYLASHLLKREGPGIRARIEIKPLSPGDSTIPATTLTLSDQAGDILVHVSPFGRTRGNRHHPLFADLTAQLEGHVFRREASKTDNETALDLCFRGFELASTFRWSDPAAEDTGVPTPMSGSDHRFDEIASNPSHGLGEFTLTEVALLSQQDMEMVRKIVAAIGLDEAILLAMELSEHPIEMVVSDRRRMRQFEQLGSNLFGSLMYAIGFVTWDVRENYAEFFSRGQLLLERLRTAVTRSVAPITHVPADRTTPPDVVVERAPSTSVGPASERQEFVERLNAWLGSDKLGTGYRFEYLPMIPVSEAQLAAPEAFTLGSDQVRVFQQSLVNLSTGMRHSFSEVGFGLAQVLPVLLTLYGRQRSSLHVEQPESHLHPALQADLGDVLITSASELGNNVVVETHSEHLILRLLRRIRETSEQRQPPGLNLMASDVAMYFVAPDPNGARVTRLHVNDDGEFTTPWPNGFFTERLEELE